MRIAITIDTEHPDNPTSDALGNAERLLDVLNDYQIQCTFFVQSSWANAYRQLARRIADDGHLIGSHGHWHCIYTSMTDEGIADDLKRSRAILDEISPTNDYFRFPLGHGVGDTRINAVVSQSGYRHIGWNCGGNDWKRDCQPAQIVGPIVKYARAAHESLIVPLLHSWPNPTAEAVKELITELGTEAEFLRLDQVAPNERPY